MTWHSMGYIPFLPIANILSRWMVVNYQPSSYLLMCRSDRSLDIPVCYFHYVSGEAVYQLRYFISPVFANDAELYSTIKSFNPSSLSVISACADTVTDWHIKNDLLLHPAKTEALAAGTKQQDAKLDQWWGIPVFGVDGPFISRLQLFRVTRDWWLHQRRRVYIYIYIYVYIHMYICIYIYIHHTRALRQCPPSRQQGDCKNQQMFTCLHDAGLLQLCSLSSYRIEHRSSPVSSNALTRVVCATPYCAPTSGLRKSL